MQQPEVPPSHFDISTWGTPAPLQSALWSSAPITRSTLSGSSHGWGEGTKIVMRWLYRCFWYLCPVLTLRNSVSVAKLGSDSVCFEVVGLLKFSHVNLRWESKPRTLASSCWVFEQDIHTSLHYITLHYMTLHDITLHYLHTNKQSNQTNTHVHTHTHTPSPIGWNPQGLPQSLSSLGFTGSSDFFWYVSRMCCSFFG